jgi:hypothetical protein
MSAVRNDCHITMSFNYSKIGTRNATLNQDDFDKSQEHGQSMMWIKAYDKLQYLRWPSAFFLLLSILVCQILIFRSQPASMPIGGELKNLVPHCKLLVCEAQLRRLGG